MKYDLKFSIKTRQDLIRVLLKDIDISFDYCKDKGIDYIISVNILTQAIYSVNNQIDKYGLLYDNNFNRLLLNIIEKIDIQDEYYTSLKYKLLGLINHYKIKSNNDIDIDGVILPTSKDNNLFKLCKLYLEFVKAKQNHDGTMTNTEASYDKFIFEKIIKQVAIDLFKKHNVSQKIKGIDNIGQSLIADTIIKNSDRYLILDAKFYKSELVHKYEKGNIVTYKHQANRFQMNAYIDSLKYRENINGNNVNGIIVHAVNKEMYNNYSSINHKTLNIADNKISIELVNIETSAEEVISQIKNIILEGITDEE